MRKTVLLYGLVGGVLIAGLRFVEYRFLVLEHLLEIYGGIIAALFAALGLWFGRRLTRTRETVIVREVSIEIPVEVRVEVPVRAGAPFERKAARLSTSSRLNGARKPCSWPKRPGLSPEPPPNE